MENKPDYVDSVRPSLSPLPAAYIYNDDFETISLPEKIIKETRYLLNTISSRNFKITYIFSLKLVFKMNLFLYSYMYNITKKKMKLK